jgi:hypothetical protein
MGSQNQIGMAAAGLAAGWLLRSLCDTTGYDTYLSRCHSPRTIGIRNAHVHIVRVFRVLTLYYECYVLPMTPTRYVAQSPRYTC